MTFIFVQFGGRGGERQVIKYIIHYEKYIKMHHYAVIFVFHLQK
jgi:hypothetical protein